MCFETQLAFIRAGEPASGIGIPFDGASPNGNALHPLAGAKLAAPMFPSTILCAGSNYREHNDEKVGSPTSGKEPEFFIKTSDSVVGPEKVFDTMKY